MAWEDEDLRLPNEPEILTTGYSPHPLQLEIHNNLKRFSVLVCHRRFGKTVLGVNTLVDANAKCHKQNPRFGYVAPFRNQAKDIAWQYFKQFGSVVPGSSFNEAELMCKTEHNGGQIKLYGADNPDALRGGYFDGLVIDEVADMPPGFWTDVIRPMLLDRNGWCLFIGTPKGINLFSQLYFAALDKPDWYAGMFTATGSVGVLPWITVEELDAAREDMTEAKYRQEFLCDFGAANDNALISIDLYRKCCKNQPDKGIYLSMPNILSVDVARFGGDSSTIGRRQGLAAFPIKRFTGIDNMALADRVAASIEQVMPDATFIDGGRGEGVIDRLRQMRYNVIEINSQSQAAEHNKYANKRAEMYDRLRKWMESGGCLPYCPRLEAQITAPRYDFDKQGRMIIEPKKDIKARIGMSPDEADTVALTFAQNVRPKNVGHNGSSNGKPREKYDVFERRNRR